jgi:hypothetical protein
MNMRLGANIRLRYGNGRGLDNDSYESAVKQFEQNNKQAISGFSAYISSFPTGIHSLQANFIWRKPTTILKDERQFDCELSMLLISQK